MNGKTKVDPTTPAYFKEDRRKGGPTAVIYGFEEVYNTVFPHGNKKYKTFQDYPLYEELNTLHLQFIKEINYDVENNDSKSEEDIIKEDYKRGNQRRWRRYRWL